jgi:rhodanese-related sulfurtransferase
MAITPASKLVEDAKACITTMSRDEAEKMVSSGKAVLVDIRDVRELQRDGRIDGAIHAPRGMLEFWVDPSSPYHREDFATDKTLILFCASSWRSALAARSLQDMGVPRVAEMDGGFKGWKKDGRPISTDEG